MNTVSANDLKRKGVSSFSVSKETLITVRGEPKFVVISLADYQELRDSALEAAVLEAREDIAKGDYIVESAQAHVKRISE